MFPDVQGLLFCIITQTKHFPLLFAEEANIKFSNRCVAPCVSLFLCCSSAPLSLLDQTTGKRASYELGWSSKESIDILLFITIAKPVYYRGVLLIDPLYTPVSEGI